jgi:trans-aconitate 2-methyltransferase
LKKDGWSPEVYARFADERRRPFADLVALVAPIPGGRAVDLGCGPGDRTVELHEAIRAKETLGIDSSPAMLGKAVAHASVGVRFEKGDLSRFEPEEPFDLVFSNAALHWAPDHPALLERLTRAVKPGGQLAFQIPDNFDHASHRSAEEAASHEPFKTALGGAVHPRHVLAPEAYASILDRLGYAEQHVRLQIYGVRLDSRKDIVSWVEGSMLSEYRSRLPPALYAEFLKRYRQVLFSKVPDERPYFFTYRRILAWGRRSA